MQHSERPSYLGRVVKGGIVVVGATVGTAVYSVHVEDVPQELLNAAKEEPPPDNLVASASQYTVQRQDLSTLTDAVYQQTSFVGVHLEEPGFFNNAYSRVSTDAGGFLAATLVFAVTAAVGVRHGKGLWRRLLGEPSLGKIKNYNSGPVTVDHGGSLPLFNRPDVPRDTVNYLN